MNFIAAVVPVALLLCGCSATHSQRITPKHLARLSTGTESFVLVFGSVKAIQNGVDVTNQAGKPGAQIRFEYERGTPPLLDLPIRDGERFYAVLRAAPGMKYLDKLSAQIGWIDSEFDPITYVRLNDRPPYAFYLGEIEMTVSDGVRDRLKQVLSVRVYNESEEASAELRRLYPRFQGELVLNSLLTARPGALPERKIVR